MNKENPIALVNRPTPNSDWNRFHDALLEAIKNIGAPYFRVTREMADPIGRERAYCYELYYRLRDYLPGDFAYTLHGEIDKAGHAHVIQMLGLGKRPNPDFVVHKPSHGGAEANLAVIEVKLSETGIKPIRRDLRKIRRFMTRLGYQHGIMLLFGSQNPADLPRLGQIEALWHRADGEEPIPSKYGRFS